jgi:hypothetical protein
MKLKTIFYKLLNGRIRSWLLMVWIHHVEYVHEVNGILQCDVCIEKDVAEKTTF